MLILILLVLVIGCAIGWMLGSFDGIVKEGITTIKKGPEPTPLKINVPEIDREKLCIWDIVRYKDNGEYDCVWSSGYTKRDADKKCAKLNSDYHKYYGKYVVEDGVYEDKN